MVGLKNGHLRKKLTKNGAPNTAGERKRRRRNHYYPPNLLETIKASRGDEDPDGGLQSTVETAPVQLRMSYMEKL